jgi:hypothetical protein
MIFAQVLNQHAGKAGMTSTAEALHNLPNDVKAKKLDEISLKLLVKNPTIRCTWFIFNRGTYFSPEMTNPGKWHNIS